MGISSPSEYAPLTLLNMKNVLKKRDREGGYRLLVASFSLLEGEYVAVTGPSGCGKSTMLDLIGMILQPDSMDSFDFSPDNLHLDINALWQKNKTDEMARIRRNYIGYVLQTGELLPFLTVRENAVLSALSAQKEKPEDVVDHLLNNLQIYHLKNALPSTLSIGERQRAAIVRALAHSPKLLLADEPTAALDPYLSRSVMELFLRIAKEMKTSVIMVSHDVDLVHEFEFREEKVVVRRMEDQVIAELRQETKITDTPVLS